MIEELVSNDTESSNLTETFLDLCRKSSEMTGSISTAHLLWEETVHPMGSDWTLKEYCNSKNKSITC